jgi:hypothetical protein
MKCLTRVVSPLLHELIFDPLCIYTWHLTFFGWWNYLHNPLFCLVASWFSRFIFGFEFNPIYYVLHWIMKICLWLGDQRNFWRVIWLLIKCSTRFQTVWRCCPFKNCGTVSSPYCWRLVLSTFKPLNLAFIIFDFLILVIIRTMIV